MKKYYRHKVFNTQVSKKLLVVTILLRINNLFLFFIFHVSAKHNVFFFYIKNCQTLQHSKVYVAPLQDETIPITNAQQASYNVECLECGTTIDALELAAHHSICKDRLYELG
jgi:hypothetical protein